MSNNENLNEEQKENVENPQNENEEENNVNVEKKEEELSAEEEKRKLDKLTPLSREDFKKEVMKHWSRLVCKNPPKRRSSHTSFIYQNCLYVIGGVDITEKKQNDIYVLNLDSSAPQWEQIDFECKDEEEEKTSFEEGRKATNKRDGKKDDKNPKNKKFKLDKIAYHAGVVYNDIYYIIGGQDERLNSSNLIQRFDIINRKILSPFKPEEDVFPPIESHTANVHSNTALIFGGQTNKDYNRNVYCIDLNCGGQAGTEENRNEQQDQAEQKPPEEQKNEENPDEPKPEGEENQEGQEVQKPPEGSKSPKVQKKDFNEAIKMEIVNLTQGFDFNDPNIQAPGPRQKHSSIVYNDCLYIYGGFGPDEKYYNDMWMFDLNSNTFTEVKYQVDLTKQPKCGPLGRTGQTMVEIGGKFYIFGGKIGLIKETNELWRFDIKDCQFELIHDTLIQQFTPEELLDNKKTEDVKTKKPFKLLTRHEVESRTNPLPFALKNKNKQKGKGGKGDKPGSDHEKEEKKNNSFTDNTKNPNSLEVSSRPNVSKMKKSLIYTSNGDDLKKALEKLSNDKNAMYDKDRVIIPYEVPEPRDGMICEVYKENQMIVFGGDRNKFPFNDLYIFDTKGVEGTVPQPEPENNENEAQQNGEEGEENKEEPAAEGNANENA